MTPMQYADLAAVLIGHLLLPGDEQYEQARNLWNGRVTTRPAAIVRCANANDVIHTVRWARAHGVPLSVRGGGHDFAGRALVEGGIVIDCSLMRDVSIDPERQVAHVQSGVTASDLITAAQPYGLVAATGECSTVGMIGFTLGGGYSPLMGAYGMGVDNLLAAQVVLANGELVTANSQEHPDLFWGLRGGGGNFGVVVSLDVRLHPLTSVLAGLLLYPVAEADAVLRQFAEFSATLPDELTVQSGFIQTPDGTPVVFLSPTYCGPPAAGEPVVAPLRSFGTVLVDQVQPVTYTTFLHSLDALIPPGRRYFARTRSLPHLAPGAIAALIEHGQPFTSPFSLIALYHLHGAASRVAPSATAFALRQEHLMVEVVPGWDAPSSDEDQQHIAWTQGLVDALDPFALPGGYVNMLDVSEPERVPLAFGANYQRLREIKGHYDPDDVFQSTIAHIAQSAS